jgi:hypothetical protein
VASENPLVPPVKIATPGLNNPGQVMAPEDTNPDTVTSDGHGEDREPILPPGQQQHGPQYSAGYIRQKIMIVVMVLIVLIAGIYVSFNQK